MSARSSARHLVAGVGLVVLGSALGLSGCGSSDDDRPERWSFIATAIIEPSCATASCHSEAGQRAGVVLTTRDKGYHALLDRFFVIPGAPEMSEAVTLMRAVGARRMPPDFALPEADIQLVERWIAAGAQNN